MTDSTDAAEAATAARRRAMKALALAAVFLCAVGVRVLHWQDNRQSLPFNGMHAEYRAHALALVAGDLPLFLRGADPPSDANFVKHPPGYPLLLAAHFKLFGQSDAALVWLHVLFDATAAVLVCLLAAELFPWACAVLAGLLVALSPQLAYHAIAPLPDPLAAPPMLLAFLFFVRAWRRPRLLTVAAAGACLGVSCWLRSNALLLAPLVALLVPCLFARGQRLRFAAALVGAYLLVVAPVTVRNYVAFGRFIPLSLSAGITMLEGISVYDTEGRFGLPGNDYEVTKQEARIFNRPDYLGTRFKPDGVMREEWRVRRGLAVIRQHPFWFASVMARRALFMLRLARVELVAPTPAVTHAPDATPTLDLARAPDVSGAATGAPAVANAQPVMVLAPADLAARGSVNAHEAALTESADAQQGDDARPQQPGDAATGQRLRLADDAAGTLLVTPPLAVRPHTDYLLRLPLKIEAGSVVVDVLAAESGAALASTPVLHPINYRDLTPESQPAVETARPFVSGAAQGVRVRLRNGFRKPARVVAELGRVELFELGPARAEWTRYPRALVRLVESLFLTATVLPLVVLGIGLLVRAGRWRAAAVLLAPAAYYMCVQSALWTEFRYILAMHYFLLILAAYALHWLGLRLWQGARRLRV
ncbi:MAG TPA: glycosyltransferase family 39 protein [Pyrinomonadaceae bacterium]